MNPLLLRADGIGSRCRRRTAYDRHARRPIAGNIRFEIARVCDKKNRCVNQDAVKLAPPLADVTIFNADKPNNDV